MSKRYVGIRPTGNNSYEISYYAGNARKQYRIQASSMREAFFIRAEHMAKRGKEVAAIAFPDLKTRLEMKLRVDGLRPQSIINYMAKFRNFFEVFLPAKKITDINKITKEIIEDYKREVVISRGRTTGWRDELTKLKAIIKKLVDIGCCNKEIYYDVLTGFKRPKRVNKLYKEVTREQMKKLLNYIKKDKLDYYGITYMIMRLGWRRGQVISIKRRNITWLGRRPLEILIEPQDTKTKEPFVLRNIDEELAKVIRQYALDRRKTIWLFPNKRNNMHHPNHYTTYINKTSQKVLGITLTPHDFRHSFCTRMLKDHTPRDIMAITGHKDIESFNIYTHPTSEGTKKVIADSKLF